MRILFPHLARFPSADAPVIQVANMAQAFAELGHSVILVAPAGPAGESASHRPLSKMLGFEPGFEVRTLSRRIHRGQSYLHALRIAHIARPDRTDLVFSRNLRGSLVPALRGIPTIFEAHTLSSLTGEQDRRILGRLMRASGFRGIVAISQALADDLVEEFRIDRERVLVAHDAVRADSEPGPYRRRDPNGVLRVGYTGSLFKGKGADALLEVAAVCPWATFSIAGGPDAVAAALRRRAGAAGLRNVTVHGILDPVDARALQQECDVLVAPFARRVESDSGHDIARWTSPMKLFEYMASGRPIVISDLPVLREVVRHEVEVLLVEPEDSGALVAALERLRDDPDLGARLAASALERVRNEFTWERRARRILARFMPAAS